MNSMIKNWITNPQAQGRQWTGLACTALVSAMMLASSANMAMGSEVVATKMASAGIDSSLLLPMGVVLAMCVVLFCIRRTSTLGAVLLTGYLGGAIFTHVRVGEAFFMPMLFAVLAWCALCLRNEAARAAIFGAVAVQSEDNGRAALRSAA